MIKHVVTLNYDQLVNLKQQLPIIKKKMHDLSSPSKLQMVREKYANYQAEKQQKEKAMAKKRKSPIITKKVPLKRQNAVLMSPMSPMSDISSGSETE